MKMLTRIAIAVLVLLVFGCSRIGGQGNQQTAGAAAGNSPGTPLGSDPDHAAVRDSRAGFAKLPDHGGLLAYPGKVVRQEGAYTWHRTDLSEEHALRAIVDGGLRVTTPEGEILDFQYDRHVEHASGDWTWIGHRPGLEGEQAILTFGAEVAFGSIAHSGKPPLRLTARDGVGWLVETDPAKVAGIVNAATRPQRPDYHIIPESALPRRAAGVVAAADGAMATPGTSATPAAATASLRHTVTSGSQFRTASQPSVGDDLAPGIARSDINGDGYDDLFYRNGGQFVYWLMRGKARLGWKQYTVKADTDFAGYGDFDGNGKADLVWIDASRDVFMWLGNGSGFTYKLTHTHGAGWSLAGIADINGDGRDDMLWYSPQLQQLVVWYMNGFTRTSYRAYTVPAGYQFAGSGDFNGDGKGDLLWDNAARDLYMWIGSGTSFGSTYLRTYQSGWNLIGTRDINGDGRSDIQWRNQSSAEVTYWLMDGTTLSFFRLFSMSRYFQSQGTGDFNGDGFGDLIWRNDARELYVSFGDGYGFSNVYVATNSEGWSVIN